MHTKNMNLQPIDGSTYMTILTMGLYLITVLLDAVPLLRAIAAIAAILAGISTFLFNVYRFYKDYKQTQNKKEP